MMKSPVVFLVCTGLGRINRGYESFTQECYEALKSSTAFDLYLIKGRGKNKSRERVIPNAHRNGRLAKFAGKIFKLHAYTIEQISFCIGILPLIIIKKPQLIYYSDFRLGSYLWHLRRYFKFKYKLLFCNGAPNGPPYKTEDHVQQLLPVYYSIGIKSDNNTLKHTLLPYAFNIKTATNNNDDKKNAREKLKLPTDKIIILSVGALNSNHKRIDYIINELSLLSDNYFLVVLGQQDDETNDLINLAEEKLAHRYLFKNVPHAEVQAYYKAADYFVLASLYEGFPRVMIEALSNGLPCIVHDYVVSRQILKEHGIYLDMRFDGILRDYFEKNESTTKKDLSKAAYTMYSWDVLKNRYIDMISKQIAVN